MVEYKQPGDVVICRCERVTLSRIQGSIADGCRTPQEVKAYTRAGMGICQGSTCGSLVMELTVALTGGDGDRVAPLTSRPPARPVSLRDLAEGYGDGGTGHGA